MLWCPLANMLPIALRMMMAKTEMTMLWKGGPGLAGYTGCACAVIVVEKAYHVHALKADTTGFMVCGGVFALPYRLRSWYSSQVVRR